MTLSLIQAFPFFIFLLLSLQPEDQTSTTKLHDLEPCQKVLLAKQKCFSFRKRVLAFYAVMCMMGVKFYKIQIKYG